MLNTLNALWLMISMIAYVHFTYKCEYLNWFCCFCR